MSISPHPVVCPKESIQPGKHDVTCEVACAAVRTFLSAGNPTGTAVEITQMTLSGLNHITHCNESDCQKLWGRVKKQFAKRKPQNTFPSLRE